MPVIRQPDHADDLLTGFKRHTHDGAQDPRLECFRPARPGVVVCDGQGFAGLPNPPCQALARSSPGADRPAQDAYPDLALHLALPRFQQVDESVGRVQQLSGPGDQGLQQIRHVQTADQPHRGFVESSQDLISVNQLGDVEIGQHPSAVRQDERLIPQDAAVAKPERGGWDRTAADRFQALRHVALPLAVRNVIEPGLAARMKQLGQRRPAFQRIFGQPPHLEKRAIAEAHAQIGPQKQDTVIDGVEHSPQLGRSFFHTSLKGLIQTRSVDGGSDLGTDGGEQVLEGFRDGTTGDGVVQSQIAHGFTLCEQRNSQESARLKSCEILSGLNVDDLVYIANDNGLAGENDLGQERERLFKRDLQPFGQSGHLRCPADAVSARQDTAAVALLHQQDHGPVAGEVGRNGLQGFVQQLIQVEGGTERNSDLVQSRQLGELLIEGDVRDLEIRVRLLKIVELLLGAVACLQKQLFRLLTAVGEPPRAPQEPAAHGRKQGCGCCRPLPSREPTHRVDEQKRRKDHAAPHLQARTGPGRFPGELPLTIWIAPCPAAQFIDLRHRQPRMHARNAGQGALRALAAELLEERMESLRKLRQILVAVILDHRARGRHFARPQVGVRQLGRKTRHHAIDLAQRKGS